MYIHNLMGYVQMYVYILVLLTDMPNGKFEQIGSVLFNFMHSNYLCYTFMYLLLLVTILCRIRVFANVPQAQAHVHSASSIDNTIPFLCQVYIMW